MTDAGRNFFLNCICYIRKFDGKGPLVRRMRSARIDPVRLAMLITKIKDKDFFSSTFTPEQLKKYENDPNGLAGYYLENYELIYWDKYYLIDEELKALGIKSNRTIHMLERLIALLEDPNQAATAERLLDRYTIESLNTPK